MKTYSSTLFENRIKTKKKNTALQFNLWQWLKTYVEFKTRKRREDKKMKTKMHKLTDNAVYSIVAISHSEYKDLFLNKKCLRHSMNRIQSKDHKIGTSEIKKFLYHALMIKYTSKTLDMVDSLLVIRINYIKCSYLDN